MTTPFEQCEIDIRGTLTRDEFSRLMDVHYDLKFSDTNNILLLGNYNDGNEELLEQIRSRINTESDEYRSFLLTEFPNDIDATAELVVAIENCEYIFIIITEDTGGVAYESGITATIADLERTHMFKRVYSDEIERDVYSYMFSESLFNHYRTRGNLWGWKSESELESKVRRLTGSIPSIP